MPDGATLIRPTKRAYSRNRRADKRSAIRQLVKDILLVQRFTAAVFHVGLPCSTNLLNHAVRQAGVIQVVSLFAAIFVRPVEELQHFCALLWFLRLFMDQDEGGGSDWPRVVTFLVSQILSESFAPVSAFCGVSKALFCRAYRFAISRDQLGVRQVVLLSVSVLNVTDRTRQTLYERSDTVITFTAQTGQPILDFHSSFTFAR